MLEPVLSPSNIRQFNRRFLEACLKLGTWELDLHLNTGNSRRFCRELLCSAVKKQCLLFQYGNGSMSVKLGNIIMKHPKVACLTVFLVGIITDVVFVHPEVAYDLRS